VEIIVIGEGDEVTTHAASIVPGVAGTSPHKLKLFTETAAGTGPLVEVTDSTALSDATKFPGARPSSRRRPRVLDVATFEGAVPRSRRPRHP